LSKVGVYLELQDRGEKSKELVFFSAAKLTSIIPLLTSCVEMCVGRIFMDSIPILAYLFKTLGVSNSILIII